MNGIEDVMEDVIEDRTFRDITERLRRQQYAAPGQVNAVCGYPMPNRINVLVKYICTVCTTVRLMPVAGVIGVEYIHEPVGCLSVRCKGQFSTVFAGVEIRSI